jgi:superfamily I DNA/RNA helicase
MAKFNNYQKEIARQYLTTKNNIAVQATAGSGKTTVLVGLANKLKKPHSFAFLAFTNATANVLKKRLPKLEHQIITTYSLGFKNLKGYFDDVKFDVDSHKFVNNYLHLLQQRNWDIKYLETTGRVFPDNDYEIKRALLSFSNLALLNLCITQEDILEFIENKDSILSAIPNGNYWASCFITELIKVSYEQLEEGLITFNEMVAWPALLDDLRPIQFAEIFVDEAQDLSLAQQVLIEKSLMSGGQIILVGDKLQAIYGFAGADTDSFNNMSQLFNCVEMPMPINYRCAKSIIRYAQETDPSIEWAPDAPEGLVTKQCAEEAFEQLLRTKDETLVIARTNTNLIKLALRLISFDCKFAFNRGVLEVKLLAILSQFKYTEQPFDQLRSWIKDQKEFAFEKRAISRIDLLECIEIFQKSYGPTNLSQFKRKIKNFFKSAERSSKITLSTIHAAKGDEANTVVYWGQSLVPHKLAKTPEELAQEHNLENIARTRAKTTLIIVEEI